MGLSGLAMLAACQTVAGGDVPARITNPSAASRAALQNAVNEALHTEVLLAADALTNSSILIIERNPPKTIQDRPVMGRVMDAPVQFRLVIDGTDCVLIDRRDDSRRVLEDTTCVAE